MHIQKFHDPPTHCTSFGFIDLRTKIDSFHIQYQLIGSYHPDGVCYHPDGVCLLSVQVAARSKAWVCGRSLAAIAGSNPVGGLDVCCHVEGIYDGTITVPETSYRA